MTKIHIITGTTRPGRLNTQVANWVHEQAQRYPDAEFELVDIADYNLPLLDESRPAASGVYEHEHTKRWAAKIAEADGYIFVTPEYNHSIAGSFKNALDFVYNEWNNKSVGFVSYGAEGGVRSVEHLRAIAGQLQLADVRSAVYLYLSRDFENYSTFKPTAKHHDALVGTLDQVVSWSRALQPIREDALTLA